jgi:hypothetical protein
MTIWVVLTTLGTWVLLSAFIALMICMVSARANRAEGRWAEENAIEQCNAGPATLA